MSKSAAKLTSSASPALANHVTWAITAGVLQRSLDSGQSWQEALRADHPLLCYASHDQDVWAGGQAGTLFHSADSGVTWLQVQPSINTLLLTSDITHIDVRGPGGGCNFHESPRILEQRGRRKDLGEEMIRPLLERVSKIPFRPDSASESNRDNLSTNSAQADYLRA